MIAHFGTGLMGAAFVRAALKRGETVHVWNRSPERAQPLAADGALVFTEPAAAARGAERIHVTLSDDASVDGVLEPLAATLDPHTAIIDHTTTAPATTAERYARWASRDRFFAHVPMFMGPRNAAESTGLMLVSGPREREARVRPLVEPMTGKLRYVGEGDSRAAVFKLFGNLMILMLVGGLADGYALAKSAGVTPIDAHGLFEDFKLAGVIDVRGKNMAEGNFAPAFELAMARKDVRLMLEEGARGDAHFALLPHVAALFDRAIAAGHGAEDVGVVAALS